MLRWLTWSEAWLMSTPCSCRDCCRTPRATGGRPGAGRVALNGGRRAAMMGRKALAGKLFYQVSLEDLVPAEHLLRRVAEAVDFAVARRLTARFYSHTGQPSVDPVVLFKMALLGYLYGLPSERRLVEGL